MPIITDLGLRPDGIVAEGRSIELEGFPLFNDPNDTLELFTVTRFDGWFDTAAVESQLIPNGGGAGAVAVGDWQPSEALYNLAGIIDVGPEALAGMRRMLLAALPADRDARIVVHGNGYDHDLEIWVRRYDKPAISLGSVLEFSVPLVAADPFKYGRIPLAGSLGVFTGESWRRLLAGDPAAGTYDLIPGGRWARTYERATELPGLPPSLQLHSYGDAPSQRLIATITGPLLRGDWWLVNETTGARLWVQTGITDGQQLVLDMHAKTATLNGDDVSHLVYGDWLTLDPGPNTYRLVTGNATEAYATITAQEAHL